MNRAGELWVASDVLYVCLGVDPDRPDAYALIECAGQPPRKMWPSMEWEPQPRRAYVLRSAFDDWREYPGKPWWWRRVA